MFVAYIEVLCGTNFCLLQNVSDVSGNDRTRKRNLTRLSKTDLRLLNHLPHMPILGSFNSAANKNIMSKILTNGGHSFLIE